MNAWEEYKYTQSADYYVDVTVYFCGATLDRRCVLCEQYLGHHDAHPSYAHDGKMVYPCRGYLMRKWYNKYTHMCVLLPTIINVDEEYKAKFTS